MKKRFYYALITLCVVLSGTLLSSCSADDAEESDGVYRYTAEQIQEIENLKEDYGVENVNIPYESTSQPLMSLSEVEEVLQIVAAFQASAKNCVMRDGNSCTFSSSKGMLTRVPTLGGESYTGSYSGSKTYHNFYRDVAVVEYTIEWKGIDALNYKDVTVTVNISEQDSIYKIHYRGYSLSYQGSCHLIVTMKFDVYRGYSTIPCADFSVNSEINLESFHY